MRDKNKGMKNGEYQSISEEPSEAPDFKKSYLCFEALGP